jgi:hypothetical protein
MILLSAPGRRFGPPRGDATRGEFVLESSDDRPGASHLRILMLGCLSEPPLQAVEIRRIRAASTRPVPRDFVFDSAEGELRLRARSVQVHESPGLACRAIIEPHRAPLLQRWRWGLLLRALRVPGLFALVTRMRARRGRKR